MEIWKQIIRQSFTRIDELANFLLLTQEQRNILFLNKNFPLLVPKRLAEKMEKSNLTDPIFLQFVPTKLENARSPSFQCDPVQDFIFKKSPKLLQKYSHRVLMLTTQACAMHCRYCFRQNFSYESSSYFADELSIIENDPSITEVILSGGDPLSLSDDKLSELLENINKIEHVKIVRFHTRFLIGIPERITASFLNLLLNIKKQVIFVIHCNHPKELDSDVISSIKQIQTLGIPIFCQTVLLKGVNDEIDTLKTLCWKLIQNGIIPYYLHQLDQVQGAMHFEVNQMTGENLIKQLRETLPGYAVFKYVKEIPNKLSKTALL